MTRYLELSALACDQSERAFSEKAKYGDFAKRVVEGYKKFLQVPESKFSTVRVDQDLETHKPDKNDNKIHLTLRDDGMWWFGFYIHYEIEGRPQYIEETTKIGVFPEGNAFRVRLDEDILVDPDFNEDFKKLFESLYDTSCRDFKADHASSKNKIGFI